MTKLKAAILDAGMHAWQLAQRAQVSETILSRIVQGRRSATSEERKRIADALGRPESEVFETHDQGGA